MKKLMVFMLMFAAFCFTGCGQKSLNCSYVNNANTELQITQNIITSFQNDSMTKMDMRIVQDLSDNYAGYADEIAKSLKEEYAKYDNKEGLKVSVVSQNKKVILTLMADFNKMDEQTKSEFNVVGTGQKMSEVKASLEEQGYTCKEV